MKLLTRRSLVAGSIALASAGVVGGGIGLPGSSMSGAAEAQVAGDGAPSLFVPIAPYRTYDSRTEPGQTGKIQIQELREVDADEDIDGMTRLPEEATAVTYTVTVTATEVSGFVQVLPFDTDFGSTSDVTWSRDGQRLSSGGNVRLNEGIFENTFSFYLDGDDFAAAHVIIDITGYYIPA